jgi:hypothetical protein
MNKNLWLKIVNPILLFSFLAQAVTSVILLIGSSSETIVKLHVYNGIFFIALALTHFILNWSWVKATFFRR